MRFKVMVTRVQVMERWVKAADEEDAAAQIHEELDQPYAYVGHWDTKSSEVEIVGVGASIRYLGSLGCADALDDEYPPRHRA